MTDDKVQTLLHVLTERGLRHWYEVALDWAARFDGWRANYGADETLSPDDHPLSVLTLALECIPTRPAGITEASHTLDQSARALGDLACAAAMSDVDLVTWQAHRVHSYPESWNPLVESFLAFASSGLTVTTWQDTKSHWPREQVRTWLLGRLKEHELNAALSELQCEHLLPTSPMRSVLPTLGSDKPLS